MTSKFSASGLMKKPLIRHPWLFLILFLLLIPGLGGCMARRASQAEVVYAPALKGTLLPVTKMPAGAEKATVGLYIMNVYDIETTSQTFYMTGYLWMRWTGEKDPSASVELTNTVEESGTLFAPVYEQPITLQDGSKYQSWRVQGRFFQPFDLRNYPLDKQKLIVQIETTNDTLDKVVFTADTKDSGFDPNLIVPGWDIKGLELDSMAHDYGTSFGNSDQTGVYPAVVFSLNLSRVQNLFIWKLMLPLFIVLLTNWLALVLKTDLVDLRTAMPATALLTMVFLQQSSLDALGQVSSLVLMDKIYAITYMLIVLTFAQIIYDNIHFIEGDEENDRILRKYDMIGLTIQLIIFFSVVGAMITAVL